MLVCLRGSFIHADSPGNRWPQLCSTVRAELSGAFRGLLAIGLAKTEYGGYDRGCTCLRMLYSTNDLIGRS